MDAERVYRLALTAYPAPWRAQREDEVLGVLLAAHPDRAGIGETMSLVRQGLVERLSQSRRPGVWKVSAAAAAMATSTALAAVAVHDLAALAGDTVYLATQGADGVYLDPLLPVDVLWLVSFALLVTRRSRSAVAASCAAAAAFVAAVALSWTPVEGPSGPLTGLEILWERLALLAPSLLLSVLLVAPGVARGARRAVSGRAIAWAFGVGAAAGALDVVSGISSAWPPILVLVVLLGSFALRGLSPRAAVLVLLGFVYVPLGGLTDGSGSRLPQHPVSLGLTLLLLPLLGGLAALLVIRLVDGPGTRRALAAQLDRAARSLRNDPPAAG